MVLNIVLNLQDLLTLRFLFMVSFHSLKNAYYVVVYNNHNKCIVQQKHSLMGQYKINTNNTMAQ